MNPKIRPIIQNIPALLREHRQWCLWIYISRDEARWTKLPLKTDWHAASSTNAETWTDFATAAKAYEDTHPAGLGYILSPDQNLSGVDLDHAIDKAGDLYPWADEIVQRLDTYTEFSPSGSGIRLFLQGKLPPELGGGKRRKGLGDDGRGEVEAYCKARFLTVTGRRFPGTSDQVQDRSGMFLEWCRETFPNVRPVAKERATGAPVSILELSDQELLDKMFRSKSGARIQALYGGDLSAHGDNHSSADMALANYLAWWTCGDVQRMDQLFRGSRLFRPKWDEKRGDLLYGQMTIGLAAADLAAGDGYSPNGTGSNFDLSDLDREEQAEQDRDALAEFLADAEQHKDPIRIYDQVDLLARLDLATFCQVKVRLRKLFGNALNLNDLTAAVSEKRKATKPNDDEEKGPTDLELALAWVSEVRDKWSFFEGEQWYRYEAGQWIYSSDTFAEAEVQHWLEKHQEDYEGLTVTVRRVANVLRLSRNHVGPYPISKLDAHPNWIALRNGVFDMDAEVLLPHSPFHWLTHQLPFDYDPNAVCPRWLRFQEETMLTSDGETCPEWVAFNQEWFGYCFIPDNKAQTSVFWVGEGGNGKGVATRVLEALLSHRQCLAVPIEQLHEPYHRAELQGKLVGFVNEPDPQSMKKNGSYFKAITGGDTLSARRPGERVFTFSPYCRLIISCNDLPGTKDLSDGYFRRVIIIEWRFDAEQSDSKDLDLDSKLAQELPGIFNWALVGLKRLQARGWKFPRIKESEKLKSAYRDSQDTVAQFVADECELSETYVVPFKDLYRAYVSWCRDYQSGRPESQTSMGRALKRSGFLPVKEDRNTRARRGLRIRADSAYQDLKLF